MRLPSTRALGRLRRLGKTVFTTNDAALCLGLSRSAASRTLDRLASAELLLHLRHGLWSLDPRIDPLLVVEHLTAPFPAYVSLQTALHLHGMISQIPRVIYLASLAPTKRIETVQAQYSVHRLSASFFGGFETSSAGIPLATPEKALLDALYLTPARSGLFTSLPEVELPSDFDRTEARRWLSKVAPGPRRTAMQRRLEGILGAHTRSPNAPTRPLNKGRRTAPMRAR